MKNLIIIMTLFSSIIYWSCEDEVDVDLGNPDEIFTIDAWLDNQSDSQRIFLSRSTDFFNNETLAPAITGAQVFVEDDEGTRFDFIDQEDGSYLWVNADSTQGFGEVGRDYTLTVDAGEVSYSATTTMKESPVVDSVYFVKDEDPFEGDFVRADFQARDLPTIGDTYWVKAYKNDEFLNKAEEINIAFEAGFTAGGGDDQNGKTFIPPVRFSINDFDEIPIYETGDEVRVEIHSISLEAFDFLSLLIDQAGREAGFGALFEAPLNNVTSNITSSRTNEQVLGIFNVADVQSNFRVLVQEEVIVPE